MTEASELPESVEPIPEYIQSFEALAALGSVEFGKGKVVNFQPHGRYFNERQTGTVRLWKESPDQISITFMGSKAGVPYSDNERITRENFNERKDVWKIVAVS